MPIDAGAVASKPNFAYRPMSFAISEQAQVGSLRREHGSRSVALTWSHDFPTDPLSLMFWQHGDIDHLEEAASIANNAAHPDDFAFVEDTVTAHHEFGSPISAPAS